MAELRGHLRLAQEAAAHFLAEGELGGEHLERDLAAQPRVERAVHDGHAATADLGLDVVERADRGVDALAELVGHGRRGELPPRGLSLAISSATYTALSTSRASCSACSAMVVTCW